MSKTKAIFLITGYLFEVKNAGSEEIEWNGGILGQVDCYLKVVKKKKIKKAPYKKTVSPTRQNLLHKQKKNPQN